MTKLLTTFCYKKVQSRYLKYACDLETSSEYFIEKKPSANLNKKEYQIWYEKIKKCKAWVYLYCALNNNKYILDIFFESWLKKIIHFSRQRTKTHKLNLFFHNLKYDGSFLLYELFKLGYIFVSSKELTKEKLTCNTLIDDKKNIYSIKFWFEGYFFKIQCSYLISRCSIANVLYGNNVKEINIEHLPNIKYTNLNEIPKRTLDYIKQDCFAITLIWKMITKLKKDSYHVRNKLSVGSWGKECADIAFHFSDWYKENKKKLKKYQWDYQKDKDLFNNLRISYHGGLTGLNKNFIKNDFIKVEGKIKTYDINSAYPFVMSNEIPYMKPTNIKNNKSSLYLIHIKSIEESKVLKTYWLFYEFFKENVREFLIWDFEFEYLNKLLKINYYIKKKFYFFWCPYYVPFINKMTSLKEKYSEELKYAENDEKKVFYRLLRNTVKLLMNSPYGKEAQKEFINIEIDKNYQWNEVTTKGKLKFTNLAGASYITAKTRSMILDLLVKFPKNILYFDTDCVHVLFDDNLTEAKFKTSIEIDEFKLGNWKFEYECEKAIYLKKKCYALMDKNGKVKVKTAGYKFDEECFDWNQFFRGNEIADISLYSFRNNWNQIILTKISKKL